jgi:beta-glucosidase
MLFQSYVARVIEALREYNTLWVTFNEPNLYVFFGYMLGLWPPGKKQFVQAGKVIVNLTRSHAAAYHTIHRLQPQAQVGLAHHYRSSRPARSWFPPDRLMSGFQSRMLNDVFPVAIKEGVLRLPLYRKLIPEAKGTQDFLGINYYTRDRVAFNLFKPGMFFIRQFFPDGSDLSDEGFIANEPDGLFEALSWARRFNTPIIITENGVNDISDQMRPRYMIQHIHQVWRAINFNYPINGYLWWSLVDNFEWERGWTQRFGLWELDMETQGRRKRPSADLYAEICHENALSSEMVAKYSPEITDKLFPG